MDVTQTTYCPKCGSGMKPTDRFCAACGHDRGSVEAQPGSPETAGNPTSSPPSSPTGTSQESLLSLWGCGIVLLVGVLLGFLIDGLFGIGGWNSASAHVTSFAIGFGVALLGAMVYQYLQTIEATRKEMQAFLDRQKQDEG